MQNTGALEDRILIRELYGLYASAGSRGGMEDWLACWADDCQWITSHFARSGKRELREQWELLWAKFSSVVVLNEIGPIEVSGDTAKASSCVFEIVRLSNGGLLKIAGHYDDQFVRKSGMWLFSRRSYQLVSEEQHAS